MKKVIVSILLIVMFFNLIQPIVSYATDTNDASDEYDEILNRDKRNITSNGVTRKENITYTPTSGGVVANILANIGNTFAITLSCALNLAVSNTSSFVFTIYDVVFKEIKVFDANYLLDDATNTNEIHVKLKEQVSIWYNALRKLAIALSLCMLLYIGIRMALSTLSEDKAKYKKMFISWVQSFILIFFMHYIILFSMVISKTLLELIKQIPGVSKVVEYKIFIWSFTNAYIKMGWDAVASSLIYWVLVFYQIKFFILYIKRALSVAFLIIISPLITVTYSADKVGDGRAQAFGTWFKEFEVSLLVQPLHALLYALFIVSASEIMIKAPLFAAIFFMGLSRAEKVVKGIFNARGMKSIHSMGKPGKRKKQ